MKKCRKFSDIYYDPRCISRETTSLYIFVIDKFRGE